jgi:hypothetical protein
MSQSIRERLPNRRGSETFSLEVAGVAYTAVARTVRRVLRSTTYKKIGPSGIKPTGRQNSHVGGKQPDRISKDQRRPMPKINANLEGNST